MYHREKKSISNQLKLSKYFGVFLVSALVGLLAYYIGIWIQYNTAPISYYTSALYGVASSYIICFVLLLIIVHRLNFPIGLVVTKMFLALLVIPLFLGLLYCEFTFFKLSHPVSMITRYEVIWRGCDVTIPNPTYFDEIQNSEEAFIYSQSLNEWRTTICNSVKHINYLEANSLWVGSVKRQGENWKVLLEKGPIPYYQCSIVFDRKGQLVEKVDNCFYDPRK